MFGKEFQKKMQVSGRSRVDQALFGLGKFINRRFKGSDRTQDMAAYNPDTRVTVPGSLPSNYKSTEAEQFRKADMYNRATKDRTDLGTGVDGINLEPTSNRNVVQYGPARRAGDFLERFVGNRFDQNQLLGYNQALMGQEAAFAAERNRQNLETTLAFDRDSPTKQQERQFKAKAGEAMLAEAVAKQASAAADIGGLGTARRFGGR